MYDDAARAAAAGMAAAAEPPEAPRPLFRDLPPAEPYPVDKLGPLLAPAAEGIHARVQAPPALCAQSVLAVASLAVQAHANVELPMGHVRPASLFCVSIAASGERKSAVDGEALWPIRAREKAMRERYEPELAAYQNDVAAWTKARESATKQGKGDRQAIREALDAIGPSPRPPLLPMLTVDEPNWPGLCRAFDEGRPALGLFSGEGGGFIGGHGMNDENRLRTATGLSTVWDGDPIRRTRAGDGVRMMPGRRLALHLMAQPGVAHRLLGDETLRDQGLVARLLLVAPDTAAGTRFWRDPPPEADAAIKRYGARILSILEAPPPAEPDRPQCLTPRRLTLDHEARRLWIATADAIEGRMGPGGPLESVRAFCSKGPEHAARIAAVLTVVDDPGASTIPADAMARAVGLLDHYTSEAIRLSAAAKVDGDLMTARRLLDWLQSWPESHVSLPDIYQYGPGQIRNKATAHRMVDILTDHGWMVPAGATTINGQRRRETWRIVEG